VIKVIVTGANGQLGSCILRMFASDEEIDWKGLGKEELDITDSSKIDEILKVEAPDVVINTAAYTAVDSAESEESLAHAINVDGARKLAEGCANADVKLVHISTDYVFSGKNGGTEDEPYNSSDPVAPIGVYGRTKYAGEVAVLDAMGEVPCYVVRTGWLYDNEGRNFYRTMLRLAESGVVRVVGDQYGTPTWAGSLARALRALVKSELSSGVYHFSERGVVSWFGFARDIFKMHGLSPKLEEISTDQYPTDAERPAFSHLEGGAFSNALRLKQRHWTESLAECVDEMKLWTDVIDKAEIWTKEPFDSETRSLVRAWIENGNREKLIDAFYQDLEFGTGGMRGKCGPGTNRINRATIAQATQGLCNYLKTEVGGKNMSVAIAYDSRLQSPELSRVTAEVLSGNGIEALIYSELRPTPQLSFTVKHLGCAAGIVITASHNPPEYNGYKVYYGDGAQITAPHDQGIINEVRKIKSLNEVKFSDDKITELGPELDEAYRKKVLELRRSKSLINEGSDVCIVYTGLHGTGAKSVPVALKEFGFKNVHEVASQAIPDGNFPTVKSPNPEEAEALSEAISLGQEIGADIVMGTDPDADRVGIAVPCKENMVLLNGNETGALLCEYVLENGTDNGTSFDENNFIASTVVTTPLIQKIAHHFNVGYRETLTGFKNIAAAIIEDDRTYVVGGEESYGYLIGHSAMDKDGVSACCVLAEMAHELKLDGSSMLKKLESIHRKYGVYQEGLVSVVKEGRDGAAQITKMMANYRNNSPTEICGEKVVEIRDFNNGSQPDFPKSNVLQFITEKGSRITVRPSGTEPKIKFYASVNHVLMEGEDYSEVRKSLKEKVGALFLEFGA